MDVDAVAIAFLVWTGIGLIMVLRSQSRGMFADTLFLFTWPIHVIMYLLGKDGH